MIKKIQIAVLVGSLVAAVAGCVSRPPLPAPIQFNYRVDNARANGIVQVFDLNGNTTVQIRDVKPKAIHFYDANNADIAFKVVGENVVLAGQHASFTVSTSAAASRVIRITPLPQAAIGAPIAPLAPAQGAAAAEALEPDAKLVADIARIRKEIAELKAMLAESARAPASSLPPMRDAPQSNKVVPDALRPQVFRIAFKDNSQKFEPSDVEGERVVAMAQRAREVAICGFTDSPSPTAAAAALARGRAVAAQKFLIAKGIDRAKITVDYEAAGKFVADNRTKTGRDANRRVEINVS